MWNIPRRKEIIKLSPDTLVLLGGSALMGMARHVGKIVRQAFKVESKLHSIHM